MTVVKRISIISLSLLLLFSIIVMDGTFLNRIFTGEDIRGLFIGYHVDEWTIITLSIPMNSKYITVFNHQNYSIGLGAQEYLEYKQLKRELSVNLYKIEEAFHNNNYGAVVETNNSTITDLLISGKVFIYDKRNSIYIKSIKLHYENIIWCPLCGYGGYTFYFMDDTEFYIGPTWRY